MASIHDDFTDPREYNEHWIRQTIFDDSAEGKEYYEFRHEQQERNWNAFVEAYERVDDSLKLSFIKDYRKAVKRLIKRIYRNSDFADLPLWDVPIHYLRDHASLSMLQEFMEQLDRDMIGAYQGFLKLDWQQDAQLRSITDGAEQQQPGKRAYRLTFDKLLINRSIKHRLILRLQQVEVLDEKGKWHQGLSTEKDARALYEALVELGLMKRIPNTLAIYYAFKDELGIKGTPRHFSSPPDQDAVYLYLQELRMLV